MIAAMPADTALSPTPISVVLSTDVSEYTDDISQSGRTHTGFTAQQVLEAMEESGLSTTDFAGFVDIDSKGEEYALRYEEFTPLLLGYIQHLEKRLSVLENNGRNQL